MIAYDVLSIIPEYLRNICQIEGSSSEKQTSPQKLTSAPTYSGYKHTKWGRPLITLGGPQFRYNRFMWDRTKRCVVIRRAHFLVHQPLYAWAIIEEIVNISFNISLPDNFFSLTLIWILEEYNTSIHSIQVSEL